MVFSFYKWDVKIVRYKLDDIPMEWGNSVGVSPTPWVLVQIGKLSLGHNREVMSEGDAVVERPVSELTGRNEKWITCCGSKECDDVAKETEVYLLITQRTWRVNRHFIVKVIGMPIRAKRMTLWDPMSSI